MGWTAQYALENERGERYDLTAPAPVYMVNVEGLGIATERDFGSLGNGFFLLVKDEIPNNPITGDLVYQEGAFGNYTALVDYIAKAKALYFCYTPLEEEYRCRVRLNYINKSRRDGAGWMIAPVSFYPLTPLYQPQDTEIALEPDGPNVKGYWEHSGEYYYEYNDDLVYGHEISDDLSKVIPPAGHESSAFLLRYTGQQLVNPVISLVGESSGTVYGECHITGTIAATDTLELCTAPDNSYIKKTTSSGVVTDLLAAGAVDLAYDPYPRAPVDESSVLTISATDRVTGSGDLIVYRYYRSV